MKSRRARVRSVGCLAIAVYQTAILFLGTLAMIISSFSSDVLQRFACLVARQLRCTEANWCGHAQPSRVPLKYAAVPNSSYSNKNIAETWVKRFRVSCATYPPLVLLVILPTPIRQVQVKPSKHDPLRRLHVLRDKASKARLLSRDWVLH